VQHAVLDVVEVVAEVVGAQDAVHDLLVEVFVPTRKEEEKSLRGA
jgi:hypothetical protein